MDWFLYDRDVRHDITQSKTYFLKKNYSDKRTIEAKYSIMKQVKFAEDSL